MLIGKQWRTYYSQVGTETTGKNKHKAGIEVKKMIVGWIIILLGVLFAVFGLGGTAKVRIEGLGGLTLVMSGFAGIILVVVGALVLAVPEIALSIIQAFA